MATMTMTAQPLAIDELRSSSRTTKIETFTGAENVTFGRLLGTGKFNYVYEARISPEPSLSSDCESETNDDGDAAAAASADPSSSSTSYVIKHLKESLADEDEDGEALQIGAADLAYEAQILSSVEHENIVKFHGVIPLSSTAALNLTATSGGHRGPWMDLVLEKLQCTLYDRIHGTWRTAERPYRRGKLPLNSPRMCRAKCQELLAGRLRAALEVARGLRHLRSQGIMHRDLKPDNVGFDDAGSAKIFDFGLAKRIDPEHPRRRPTGMVGTFRYMAPEVAKCKMYDPSADVYSFGLILWEICALEKAFGDITRRDFQDKVMFGTLRPGLSSSWSSPLRGLMTLCWSPDAAERPAWDVIVSLLEREMDTEPARDATPPRMRMFGRRSSMPMKVQFGRSSSAMTAQPAAPMGVQFSDNSAGSAPGRDSAAPKKRRPKWGRRSSASMIMQTTVESAGADGEGSNRGRPSLMGDRPQFTRQISFPRRPSLKTGLSSRF